MASPSESATLPLAVELLRSPSIHIDEPGIEAVELRDTHISWLLFTPRFVYKVKKPVEFGFLDFSTLERRHEACLEETRLNRRLSPRVYRGVVAICDGPDGSSLEPTAAGETAPADVVDYAVKMLRLADGLWLADLLREGTATRPLMHRIAHRLVGFHALAERSDGITREGALETVRANVAENFEQTEQFTGSVINTADRDMARAYARAFLDEREEVFRSRERAGRVCDGHGDLHAAQIHAGRRIDFIDCIEFNRRFRCADVAADLAFTTMDLDFSDRPDLADALVLEYMARSGDTDLLKVLTFYACYRAFTRAKVECLRMDQLEPDAPKHLQAIDRAGRYAALAASYARPRAPIVLLTSGLMGSGKSTLAEGLGRRLEAEVVSSDRVRKELAGRSADDPASEAWGEGIYTAPMSDRTYTRVIELGLRSIENGRHAILDASFASRRHRQAAARAFAAVGARCLMIVTVIDETTQRSRLARRVGRSGASDGRLELLEAQRSVYEPPDEVPDRVVMSTEGTPDEVAATALERLMRLLLRD